MADFAASAVHQAQRDFGLSKRELEVLALIAEGGAIQRSAGSSTSRARRWPCTSATS